jgi:hypothetical protein
MSLPASAFTPPAGHPCVKVVHSFHELVTTPFGEGVNALCWPRTLPGDFEEIVTRLGTIDEITGLDDDDLRSLVLTPAGQAAREVLLADQRLLRDYGLAPTLDCIPAYPRDEEPGPVPTDVYSFHADSATVLAATYLCSYTEASSEGVDNEEAVRCVDIPEIRASLLKTYGGPDDDSFRAYLNEHFFDLHYEALPHARPFSRSSRHSTTTRSTGG